MYSLDNAYLNDILCYISTSRLSLSDEDIILNSVAFYKENAIKEAKEAFCRICDERFITRKACTSHPNPSVADIQDILNLFSKMEENSKPVPKFYAKSYDSLPPVGFQSLASVICSLRDEVSAMRVEINQLRNGNQRDAKALDDLSNIVADIGDIKISLNQTNSVLKNGNGSADLSTPSTSTSYAAQLSANIPPNMPKSTANQSNAARNNGRGNNGGNNSQKSTSNQPSTPFVQPKKNQLPARRNSHTNDARNPRNFARKNITGTRTTATGGLAGVERVVDLFLGGCSLDSSADQIKNFCESSNVPLKNCEDLESKSLYYKSYKISVPISLRDQLLNEEFWPTGIFIRKFYKPKVPVQTL